MLKKNPEYGWICHRPGVDGKVTSASSVQVYRIGPRGGKKEYDGSCRVDELTKFYGDNVRQLYPKNKNTVRVQDEGSIQDCDKI